jgi:hypothetical protein
MAEELFYLFVAHVVVVITREVACNTPGVCLAY